MSFPWWESKIPEDYRATFTQKLETMLVEETKRRAQILYSLGFNLRDAQTRVRAYLRWDYETGGAPKAAATLDAVVAEIYGRRAGRAVTPAPAAAAAKSKTAPAAKSKTAPAVKSKTAPSKRQGKTR